MQLFSQRHSEQLAAPSKYVGVLLVRATKSPGKAQQGCGVISVPESKCVKILEKYSLEVIGYNARIIPIFAVV